MGSSGVGVVTSLEQAPKAVDLEEVRNTLIELIDDDAEQRGDGTSLAGTFVRLAWHCSGTYNAKDGTGGSNGAKMRFPPEKDYGSNAGKDKRKEEQMSVFCCCTGTTPHHIFL